ncbi:hypothetical protein [Nereida ignava]|uniref:Uncharacterized protein n=1 Tax=Nereida ignava TaxID=282199 RepID=A0A0U1NN02_9RHOB|nr:hypothetical protein [Nereida ignava]CRK75873.1 hypothetical protein NIG5292_01929 [Nereida ignava]SFJ76964.1 hypothetical protein SAMN02745667_02313 [Nereida ignava DSM 16309]
MSGFEYFNQSEVEAPMRAAAHVGDFALDGHRLSSLYRAASISTSWLNPNNSQADYASLWAKYSYPAGIPCPTFTFDATQFAR